MKADVRTVEQADRTDVYVTFDGPLYGTPDDVYKALVAAASLVLEHVDFDPTTYVVPV